MLLAYPGATVRSIELAPNFLRHATIATGCVRRRGHETRLGRALAGHHTTVTPGAIGIYAMNPAHVPVVEPTPTTSVIVPADTVM